MINIEMCNKQRRKCKGKAEVDRLLEAFFINVYILHERVNMEKVGTSNKT